MQAAWLRDAFLQQAALFGVCPGTIAAPQYANGAAMLGIQPTGFAAMASGPLAGFNGYPPPPATPAAPSRPRRPLSRIAAGARKPSVVHCPHHRSGVRYMPIGYPEHIQGWEQGLYLPEADRRVRNFATNREDVVILDCQSLRCPKVCTPAELCDVLQELAVGPSFADGFDVFKLRASDVRDDTDAKQLSAQSLFDRDFLVCSRHPDDPKARSALTNAEYVLISPADGAEYEQPDFQAILSRLEGELAEARARARRANGDDNVAAATPEEESAPEETAAPQR
ncbi:hypothetical protein WJX75_006313 [Coccomyxa subellipsoidea]|uniref:Uncharacterized protein n=1 Tax=Coccomyxa subellipsoidea TaxID=248742 RepID=A0ABR2Z3E9_9CHLO